MTAEDTPPVQVIEPSPDVLQALQDTADAMGQVLGERLGVLVGLVESARDVAVHLEGRLEQATRHLEALIPLLRASTTWAQDTASLEAASDWVEEERRGR
jgi:hypothetical protein